MLERMSASEYEKWQLIYYKLAPFGDFRADLRSGMQVSPIVNMMRQYLYKDPEMSKPSDWLVDFLKRVEKKIDKPQDWRHMRAVFKAIADAYKVNQAQADMQEKEAPTPPVKKKKKRKPHHG